MTDLFDSKTASPMLIGVEQEAFNSDDFMFELKLDGERCLAYLDPKEGTELRNKRQNRLLGNFPELAELHKRVKKRCILDGELIVVKEGKPSFSHVQSRTLMGDPFKISVASKQNPASFVAYDILYFDTKRLTEKPLTERVDILHKSLKNEDALFSLSAQVHCEGIGLFEQVKKLGLEGVVGKRIDSTYHMGKRTKDWIKSKYLLDDDFYICGYIIKSPSITSLVLGQIENGALQYKGHVTMGISKEDFRIIQSVHELAEAPVSGVTNGSGNDRAVWIEPVLVCTVCYMERTANGGMRQPVYKGLRMDKSS